jgi:HAD superfamily hydrolase (TIGR01509 family)
VTKAPASRIQLVVFDLGRVLLRICDDWREACRRAGVSIPPERYEKFLLEETACQHDTGKIRFADFASSISSSIGVEHDRIMAVSRAFLHGAYPGTTELLDELRARDVTTACLSNTNDYHWALMNDSAGAEHIPLDRLTYRFASHLVRARKPHPEIYAHLERETGVGPAGILFFDDIEENIQAARDRGWNVRHVDPKSPDPIAFIRSVLRDENLLG